MKKLFGMDQYKTELKLQQNDDIVQYGDEKLKALNGYTMSSLFKYLPDGNHWGLNKILQENGNADIVFQLGWSSIVLAEIQDNNLKIIKALKNANEKIISAVEPVLGILTRAVDTCTFLWLKINNYIIVAHFNNSETKEFTGKIYDLIKEKIPTDKKDFSDLITGSNVELFISYCELEGRDVDDFYKKLKINEKSIVFKRNTEEFGRYSHYSHFEIGIYIQNGEIEMFGDVTSFSNEAVLNPKKIKEAPSVYFEDKKSFLSYIRKKIKKSDNNEGCGCIIS